MPLRVLFVSHTATVSGAERVLLDVATPWAGSSAFLFEAGQLGRDLTGRGLRVIVAAGRSIASVRRDAPLLSALPSAWASFRIAMRLASAARRHAIVYANSQKAFTLAAVTGLFVRRPLIWHLHDILSAEHFTGWQRRLQVGLANRAATRVIVPSRATGDAFVKAGGRRDLVLVIPNGVAAPAEARPRAELRAGYGFSGRTIGVFSRLSPWKGQHVVLDALAHLPGVSAVFAGSALFGETAYEAALHARAAALGLSDRVTFLGQRDDVSDLMRAVDVVVHPSVSPEPFGLTVVEAMLARTPVVATATGAPVEILGGGLVGRLVAPGDPRALASAVDETLSTGADDLVVQLEAAFERARRCFGLDAMRAATRDAILAATGGRA